MLGAGDAVLVPQSAKDRFIGRARQVKPVLPDYCNQCIVQSLRYRWFCLSLRILNIRIDGMQMQCTILRLANQLFNDQNLPFLAQHTEMRYLRVLYYIHGLDILKVNAQMRCILLFPNNYL